MLGKRDGFRNIHIRVMREVSVPSNGQGDASECEVY